MGKHEEASLCHHHLLENDVSHQNGSYFLQNCSFYRLLLTGVTLLNTLIASLPTRHVAIMLSRIQTRVTESPDNRAVCFGDQSLTYGDLWRRSAGLASQLRERGIGPDQRVVVCIPPSVDAIVAIIAVLRSGGAYLPIATDTPSALIRHVVADAQPKLVLSDLGAECFGSVNVLPCHGWRTDAPDYRDEDLLSPQQLAYVIYTSGSTGPPKGVMVEHGSLESSLAARRAVYGDAPYSAILVPSLAFDSSVAVIFPVLCQGGSLIIASQTERRDLAAVFELIETHSPAEMLTLPAVYQILLEYPGASKKLSGLKRVIVAGDRLAGAVVQQHFQTCSTVELYNEYGPTEATVWSTVHRCSQLDSSAPVSIGKAVPGTTVFILNADTFKPSPPGIEGDIFIGGPSVTRGYLGDSVQTALNYLPDPFARVPGARLYLTGDRGQMKVTGDIEFIGRNDDQVKIRGYRVALGHVENKLTRPPQIQVAAVVFRRAAPWKDQLVAFFESRNSRIGIQALQAFLLQKLADYMLPVACVQLPTLPRTSNGKLDRIRMATYPAETMFAGADHVSPRTALEEQLCEIWSQVLQISSISVLDHYLDFGADSIAAMQSGAPAGTRGIPMPPADVFSCGTVAAIAAGIAGRHADGNLTACRPAVLPSEGPLYNRTS